TTAVSHIAPPGKEGLDISHESGEHEVFEDLVETLAQSDGYHHVDDRTCHDHVENQIHQWGIQMLKLLDAYLDAHTRNDSEGMPKMSDQLSDL
ncbi:hypothetical protein L208DRAFT_1167448, partial [Tricholoma matsutake]